MPLFNIANGETGISVRTKLNAKLSPVLNVKADFGAKGDGSTDDTAAIQACFDFAFGPASSPHGLSANQNYEVYFPPGTYIVTPSVQRTVTNTKGLVKSATVAAGGSGGANGPVVLTVVGGTGSAATLNGTITGGVLTAINSVATPGSYTAFPSSPASVTGGGLTGATVNLVSAIQLTLGAPGTTGMSVKQQINVRGVTGTVEANGTWFYIIDDSTHITLTTSAFTNAYVSGGNLANAAVNLYGVLGANIYGAGRFTTEIKCNTSYGITIGANGCGYSSFRNMIITGASNGVAFDYNWDDISPQSSQSCSFRDVFFGGSPAVCLQIGAGGNMSSETLVENCYIAGGSKYGIYIGNQNAVMTTIIGGNIASCDIGISIVGSAPIIHGVSFQLQTTWDIQVIDVQGDCYSIHGCRTESVNFAQLHAGPGCSMGGCSQANGTAGVFVFFEGGQGVNAGALMMDGCYSQNGTLSNSNGDIYIRGCLFGNTGYLSSFNGTMKEWHSVNNSANVADLPTASSHFKGCRTYVVDANITASGNFATNISGHGSGSNTVPVWCDGTNWLIG
jgi:hypothetical protein